MPGTLRFRSGQVELHRVPVNAATELLPGDVVYLDEDDVKPARQFPFGETLDATRASFATVFLGVCHHRSAAGETGDVSVDLSPLAIYEFDVDAATYVLGDPLACDGNSDQLSEQRLTAVANPAHAIARASESKSIASTLLRVQFASAFHTASSNVNAAVG